MNPIIKKVLSDLDKLKLLDVKVYDLKGKSIIADHFIVATSDNQVQMEATRNRLIATLASQGMRLRNPLEGFEGGWLLLDFGNIIVHVFMEEMRAFYHLDAVLEDVEGSDVMYEEVTAKRKTGAAVKTAKDKAAKLAAGKKAVKRAVKTTVRKKQTDAQSGKQTRLAVEKKAEMTEMKEKKASPKKTVKKAAPAKASKTVKKTPVKKPAAKKPAKKK